MRPRKRSPISRNSTADEGSLRHYELITQGLRLPLNPVSVMGRGVGRPVCGPDVNDDFVVRTHLYRRLCGGYLEGRLRGRVNGTRGPPSGEKAPPPPPRKHHECFFFF